MYLLCLLVAVYLGICRGCTTTYRVVPRVASNDCVRVEVLAPEALTLHDCIEFSQFLKELQGGCSIEVELVPGANYTLRDFNITISASLKLRADGVPATIKCSLRHRRLSSKQILFGSIDSRWTQVVSLNNITFDHCGYSLKFDYLSTLNISGCTFRYSLRDFYYMYLYVHWYVVCYSSAELMHMMSWDLTLCA